MRVDHRSAAVIVLFVKSSTVASVDIVNPSLIRRPHTIWCIQQFDSQLSDVAVYLLSRLPATALGAKKKVSCSVIFQY